MKMPLFNRPATEQGNREPIITLDDCLGLAQQLLTQLNRLAVQKHPLQVRKGLRVSGGSNLTTKTLKGATRTYFFDLRTGPDGRRRLVITESRLKDHHRSQVTVDAADAADFVQAVAELI